MTWPGGFYTLSIRRRWRTFGALAAICELNNGAAAIPLNMGRAEDILHIHKLVAARREDFTSLENWYFFSCRVCDLYCDHYAIRRAAFDNPFYNRGSYLTDENLVREIARSMKGYREPDK